MRTVYVIGIGAGDPDHLTLQAVAAMNRVDVFLTVDKGAVDKGPVEKGAVEKGAVEKGAGIDRAAAADLAALRHELLARHVRRPHRVVAAPEVPRDRAPADYVGTATSWQARREALYEEMIDAEVPDGATGGFLVWGDPSLYDGTLTLLHRIAARAAADPDHSGIRVVAIPGVSSVAALAAAFGLVLNRVGAPVLITTGRRLAERGMPHDVDDVVVMLDGRQAFTTVAGGDLDIYWGAYLGTKDEILVAGPLPAVRADILAQRAAARERKGWIMDTYLLRRRD